MPRILKPPAAGIDISDTSIKWLALEGQPGVMRVRTYGEEELSPGIVVAGLVHDVPKLGAALAEVKKKMGGVTAAHAALPEEAAYVFNMHVPDGSARDQILNLIEFELQGRVPIAPSAAVYDFNTIVKHEEQGEEIGVVVFPRELAESYVAAFDAAGLQLLSLEVEARSIARAVSGVHDEPITLLVDFGRARTGLAVLKGGVPIFTSTVAVGGDAMTHAVMDVLKVSEEDARAFNNDQGLLPTEGARSPGLEALTGAASALADEVARLYHYWDTRRDEHGARATPVEQVYLVGGASNLRGLDDYIAGRVQASTLQPDMWRNVCSFDDYIPPIDRRTSFQYGTAIGLALRGV